MASGSAHNHGLAVRYAVTSRRCTCKRATVAERRPESCMWQRMGTCTSADMHASEAAKPRAQRLGSLRHGDVEAGTMHAARVPGVTSSLRQQLHAAQPDAAAWRHWHACYSTYMWRCYNGRRRLGLCGASGGSMTEEVAQPDPARPGEKKPERGAPGKNRWRRTEKKKPQEKRKRRGRKKKEEPEAVGGEKDREKRKEKREKRKEQEKRNERKK